MCIIKEFKNILTQRQKNVTKDYNCLMIVMNSAFIKWFIVFTQIKPLLLRKARYLEKNSAMSFVSSVIIFSLGDTFFINKLNVAFKIIFLLF